ncbi:uncharacterized protein LOC115238865 [Formica exsecta]|uniref:uncharacterized protein LOC115238865 n=1 Tax=Formica exsecta TaxID=72781 RepID=UPI001141F558|nr:uncharacterized protein LOC115238865 [Formica exsecta]
MRTFLPIVAIIALCFPIFHSLIGYDCGGQGLNITSLSLLDIGRCEVDNLEPNKEDVYVQLLQLSEYDRTDVIQCKIEVDQTIYYCGMHSHISIVQGGRRQYMHELSDSICKKMQNSGAITMGTGQQSIIQGLKRNSTNTRSITLAGSNSVDGRCSGTEYSDAFGIWEDVVVQAVVKVTLRDFEVSIERKSNEVILPSGVHCKASPGECLDTD